MAADESDDLALLTNAAREAGAIAMDYFRGDVKSWIKDADATPVSEADLEIDRLLHRRLTTARPDYGWLSEETEDDPARLSKGRVFVVDPIDGTRAFLKGRPHFCISLAVVENGQPQSAVIFNPATDELFSAEAGCGALMNGAAMGPSDRRDLEGARMIGAVDMFRHPNWNPPWPADIETESRNSIAYTICLVAAGVFDGSVKLSGISDWDIAAACLIAGEAGCPATDHRGNGFVFNQRNTRHMNIVAAGPALHEKLIDKLMTQFDPMVRQREKRPD